MNLIILGILAHICFINGLNIGVAISLLPYDDEVILEEPGEIYSIPASPPKMTKSLPEVVPIKLPGQPGQAANEKDNGKENISPPKLPEPSP